jgi:uncharacterized protein (DUF2235 family)
MAPPGYVTKTGSFVAQLLGLALGYGLTNDLRDAYVFVSDNFEPGDRLYLFGFSRGSYTVRALASLLRLYGLIERRNEPLVPYMVRMMWAIHRLRKQQPLGASLGPQTAKYFQLARDFKETFSIVCKPHFVGVWDTVSSVGWFTSPVSLPYTANNGDIAIGRHAIAIDESRTFYRQNLWFPSKASPNPGPRNLRQVWFPGVHSDVGGGYPEAESGLSKFALQWMLDEAIAADLRVDPSKMSLVLGQRGGGFACADADACLHDSLTALWRPLEFVPKPQWDPEVKRLAWRANLSRRRMMPKDAVVHDAAWAREGGRYAERYLSPNAIPLSSKQWDVPSLVVQQTNSDEQRSD